MGRAAGGLVAAGELAAADGAAVLDGAGAGVCAKRWAGGVHAGALAVGVTSGMDVLLARLAAIFGLGGLRVDERLLA